MSLPFKLKPTNPICSSLSVGKDVIVKNTIQQRSSVPSNDTSVLRRATNRCKATLTLLLLVSSYCIELAHSGQVSPSSVNGLGKGLSPSMSSSGKDGSGGKAVDDSETSASSHHHSHHRQSYSGNRHHRHGSTSGKNSPYPPSSIYPSTSGALGYQDYSPLSYYPEAYYEPRYHERPSREFSARSTSYPAIAAAASSQVGFTDTEYGGLALATGHGGGHHGGGHHDGHGAGHGHYTTYHKTINKLDQSSLGLLGLLGLLSLLSNVLMLLTTTTANNNNGGGGLVEPANILRLKRDTMMLVKLKDDDGLTRRTIFERLSRLILPSLNVVGHAKDGRIPLNCTFQEVCKTNKVLVQVFGANEGRPVASVLSTAIVKLLMDNNNAKRQSEARIVKERHYQGTTGAPVLIVEKLLTEAGIAGRNGADCELAYPTCKALGDADAEEDNQHNSFNGIYRRDSFKLPLLVSPERALAIILGQGDT